MRLESLLRRSRTTRTARPTRIGPILEGLEDRRLLNGTFRSTQFGLGTDTPVPADYDGDGKTDLGVVRNEGGAAVWYLLQSRDGFRVEHFGYGDGRDVFKPADYDGDGKADVAVTRDVDGLKVWYQLLSASPKVLYVNFDGASMSHADLVRWDEGQWYRDETGRSIIDTSFDPEGDGVTVRPFLDGAGDREAVIGQVIALLQEDLRPFGITVQRYRGLAVEGVGTTTVFVGPSDHGLHIASDIDYGNVDRTDIAFVGDESYYWPSRGELELATADVLAHETGHTYGLYHVTTLKNGVAYPETMGWRYTVSQGRWATDTGYLDSYFDEYLNHGGGRGPQNSYRYLMSVFGPANDFLPRNGSPLKPTPYPAPPTSSSFATASVRTATGPAAVRPVSGKTRTAGAQGAAVHGGSAVWHARMPRARPLNHLPT